MAAIIGAAGPVSGQTGPGTPGKWQSPGQRHLLEHRPMFPSSRLASSTQPASRRDASDSDDSDDTTEEEDNISSPLTKSRINVNTRLIKPHGFTSRPRTHTIQSSVPRRATASAALIIPTTQSTTSTYEASRNKRRKLDIGSGSKASAPIWEPLGGEAEHAGTVGLTAQDILGDATGVDEHRVEGQQESFDGVLDKGKGEFVAARGNEGLGVEDAASSVNHQRPLVSVDGPRAPHHARDTATPHRLHENHNYHAEAGPSSLYPSPPKHLSDQAPTTPKPKPPHPAEPLANPTPTEPSISNRLSESPEPLEPPRLTPVPTKQSNRAAAIAALKARSVRMSGTPDSFARPSRPDFSTPTPTVNSPAHRSAQRHPYLSRKARRLSPKASRLSTGAATAGIAEGRSPAAAQVPPATSTAVNNGTTPRSRASPSIKAAHTAPHARSGPALSSSAGLRPTSARQSPTKTATASRQPKSPAGALWNSPTARQQLPGGADVDARAPWPRLSSRSSAEKRSTSRLSVPDPRSPSTSPDPISLDTAPPHIVGPSPARPRPSPTRRPRETDRPARTDALTTTLAARRVSPAALQVADSTLRVRRDGSLEADSHSESADQPDSGSAVTVPDVEVSAPSTTIQYDDYADRQDHASLDTATSLASPHVGPAVQALLPVPLVTAVDDSSPDMALEPVSQRLPNKTPTATLGSGSRLLDAEISDESRQGVNDHSDPQIQYRSEEVVPLSDGQRELVSPNTSTVHPATEDITLSAQRESSPTQSLPEARQDARIILVETSDEERPTLSDMDDIESDQPFHTFEFDISRTGIHQRGSPASAISQTTSNRPSADIGRVMRVPDSDTENDDIVIIRRPANKTAQLERGRPTPPGASNAVRRTRTSLSAQTTEVYDLTMDSDDEDPVSRPVLPTRRRQRLRPSSSAPSQIASHIVPSPAAGMGPDDANGNQRRTVVKSYDPFATLRRDPADRSQTRVRPRTVSTADRQERLVMPEEMVAVAESAPGGSTVDQVDSPSAASDAPVDISVVVDTSANNDLASPADKEYAFDGLDDEAPATAGTNTHVARSTLDVNGDSTVSQGGPEDLNASSARVEEDHAVIAKLSGPTPELSTETGVDGAAVSISIAADTASVARPKERHGTSLLSRLSTPGTPHDERSEHGITRAAVPAQPQPNQRRQATKHVVEQLRPNVGATYLRRASPSTVSVGSDRGEQEQGDKNVSPDIAPGAAMNHGLRGLPERSAALPGTSSLNPPNEQASRVKGADRTGTDPLGASTCAQGAWLPSTTAAIASIQNVDACLISDDDGLGPVTTILHSAREMRTVNNAAMAMLTDDQREEMLVSGALQSGAQANPNTTSPIHAPFSPPTEQPRGQDRSASVASESLGLVVDSAPYVDPIIRRGMAQLNMVNRSNGPLVAWSTRTVPGSVGDLQAELDDIWDGGSQRPLMLWHEEEMFKQYERSKEMRWFQACWDRMNRIEPFPAKNALQVDKQKFLTSFLGRFGAFMRKHGLHKAFQSHLTWMSHQDWIGRTTLDLLLKEWDEPGTVAAKHRKDAAKAKKKSRFTLGVRGKSANRARREGHA